MTVYIWRDALDTLSGSRLAGTGSGALALGGATSAAAGGDIFYSVLVEWWLTDGEEPLPMAMPQAPPGGNPTTSPARPASVPQTIRCFPTFCSLANKTVSFLNPLSDAQ